MYFLIQLKVCLMEQVRLRYERSSTIKRLAFSKDDWDTVKAKIASAYGVTGSLDNAYIVVLSEAELDSSIGSMFPTIGCYVSNVHTTGMGRAIFGLFIQDDASIVSMHPHNL